FAKGTHMTTETDLLPLPSGNVAHLIAAQTAEIEALRTEVSEWKRVASAQAELHGKAEDRAERPEKTLSAYQTAVNTIDDLIEYSLPMPPETKAALYAVLADLTATLAQGNRND